MLRSLPGPELAIVLGVVCIAVAGAIVLLLAVVVILVLRRRRPSPTARADALASLGYRPTSGGGWSMPIYGTQLVFDETDGWRWTVRLPRYNTLSLAVEERSEVPVPDEDSLLTSGFDAVDARFVMVAERSAQTVALVRNPTFGQAMLAVPFLALLLKGDELMLEDPKLKGLTKLAGSATPGTPAAIAAECEVHKAVAALVMAMFDTMYSKQTGTIMPEHR